MGNVYGDAIDIWITAARLTLNRRLSIDPFERLQQVTLGFSKVVFA